MARAHVADLVTTLRADKAKFDKDIDNSKLRLRGYTGEAKKSTAQNDSLSDSFKNATGKASELPGPLGEISGKVDGMIDAVSGLGLAWTAVGGGVAVAIGAISAGLPTLAETERRLLQQEQLIKATGYSSGYTAKQLDEMARSVAMATLTSTQEASKAIGVMLTFRGVMGDTFERAIYLAQDVASVWGTDIAGGAEALGEALNDPIEGLGTLGSFGVSFTDTQKDMVKAMVDVGDTAKAQGFILDELQSRFGGGASAEASGLIGTTDTMIQTWSELLETMADKSGSMFFAKTTLQGLINIASGLQGMIDPAPMVEFNELFKERLELSERLKKMGPPEDLLSINPLPGGESKNTWFNANRRHGEVTARMKELQEAFKKEAEAQSEAQKKAKEAAEAREKQRIADNAAQDKKAQAEKAAQDKKRLAEQQAREDEAADAARLRDQEQTDTWLVELERRNMSEMELLNAKYMDEAMKLAEKKQNELITEEEFQQSLQQIQQYYSDQRVELLREELEAQKEEQEGFWDRYYQSMQESAYNTDEMWSQTFDSFTSGFGNAFASAIMQSETFGDAMKNMAAGMAQSMLAALGKIMAQRLVMWALEKTMLKGSAASQVAQVGAEAQSAALLSGIHAFSSTAAIPIVGPVMAPGAMAAALAVTEPMAALATTAAASGFAGAFDNGGYIPAGQWGVTGEYGPEITLGPSHIIGRKQTMSMLQQASSGSNSGGGDVIVHINNVPEGYGGTATQSKDENGNDTINIMLQDLRDNGPYTTAFQHRHGLKRQGN
ncbi:phage tail tape measure protein [Aliivibrio fischeri]|uniref:phage tail length tape measure family protein n=1 Tax=Aliivibrio fischeri TaxID=668 RepID=UPI00080E0F7F|nr:phage tail length tape measure family protein [Aliivibrio fischeri]OCH31837.1 phage tail tape measure protein [Aliivibrio fischeri]